MSEYKSRESRKLIIKIRVTEHSGEVGKIPGYLNYEFRIDLKAPSFKKRFFKERAKARSKYLKIKRGILRKWIKKKEN